MNYEEIVYLEIVSKTYLDLTVSKTYVYLNYVFTTSRTTSHDASPFIPEGLKISKRIAAKFSNLDILLTALLLTYN